MPLAEVVLDCTRQWFEDALKEACAGDAAMQMLVGQMYRSGYTVNENEHKCVGGAPDRWPKCWRRGQTLVAYVLAAAMGRRRWPRCWRRRWPRCAAARAVLAQGGGDGVREGRVRRK